MAEPISIQQLKDASLDVKSLEEVVNGDENVVVTTRLGETYPSVKGSIKKVFEIGGLPATPFATKALMTASALVDGDYAMVTDDTVNNGLYIKMAGAWVKSAYDPVAVSNENFTRITGLKTTKNLVDKDTAVVAKGVFSVYSINGNSPWHDFYHDTTYYPASVGQKFWVTKGVLSIQFCRADQSVIYGVSRADQAGYITNLGVLTIPQAVGSVSLSSVAYIRLSFIGENSMQDGLIAMGQGDKRPLTIPEYNELLVYYSETPESMGAKAILNDFITDGINTQVGIEDSENLVNPNASITQGYYSGGGQSSGGAGFYDYFTIDDYYPAKVGDVFWTKNVSNIQYCRADKTVIWGDLTAFNYINGGILTIPSSIGSVGIGATAYIRIGTTIGEAAIRNKEVALGVGSHMPNNIPDYGVQIKILSDEILGGINAFLDTDKNALKGARWVAMGDSITAYPNSYANQLAKRHGAVLIKHARDMARVHRENPDDTRLILSEDYLNISTDTPPDIITIAGGINDPIASLGVFSDRTINTFYGALHVLLAGLRERFTDARIGYIAPIPTNTPYIIDDMSNTAFIKYKAIKEVCSYYGVPVWNGNEEFGATPRDLAWKGKYMPDTVHPNYLGHTWYANRVEDFILRLAK